MEDVVGDFVVEGVLADLLGGPVGDGVDFVCVVGEVFFDDLDFGALHSLVAAKSGDPSVGFAQGFIEGVDLADFAAEFAVVDAFVEEVHAVLADHASDFTNVWVVDFHLGVVAAGDAVHEIVGLFEESHGVECGESGFGVDLPVHVEDGHSVDGERGHLDGAIAEGIVDPLEDV